MKRVIVESNEAIMAENTAAEDQFNDLVGNVESDFDYLVDTMDKLVREGDMTSAMNILTNIHDFINNEIETAVGNIGE